VLSIGLPDPFWSVTAKWSAADMPAQKPRFGGLLRAPFRSEGKTCRVNAAHPGHLNHSLTTPA
jgi:hypothetical protein